MLELVHQGASRDLGEHGGRGGITSEQEAALMGALAYVERITGDTLTEVEDILDQLATEGRRFVACVPELPPEPPPPTTAPTVYVVQPGDTLWSISTKVFGTGSLSQIIFEAT